jgi:hypothetical protein
VEANAARPNEIGPKLPPAESDIHLHPAGGEIRPRRIADDEIFDALRSKADAGYFIAGLHAPALELALDEARGDADPREPEAKEDCDDEKQQPERDPAPDGSPPDHRLLFILDHGTPQRRKSRSSGRPSEGHRPITSLKQQAFRTRHLPTMRHAVCLRPC